MTRPTTRRALIGGACVFALADTAASAKSAPSATVSTRLARLIALRDRADAAFSRYDAEVEAPAYDALKAIMAACPAEPDPPHRSVQTTFINVNDEVTRLSTAGFSDSTARKMRDDPTWADMGADQPEWRQAFIELADLADERDAIIADQQARREAYEQRARERLRIDEIQKRSDELSRREYSLWEAVIDEPATNLADVLAKLDLMKRTGRDDEDGYLLTAISRDIRGIAAGGAA
ncbi:hypothetical protein J2Y58_002925 [Sphingomonas sp. BE138]|uniref:hypothetical protein n=1 Tax=Sphingomonas sp. BE138 TaxID=2817845 RepID=UPI00285F2ED5|nr:hypothetical protein [Sphingomonas sp. BE138]MDR6789552.1 hypothetical protein [Sphingomonas sp. BE138]